MALQSMFRVLKPGGKLIILEFSHPQIPFIQKLYDAYSFKLIPKMGEFVANDRASYQYLVESIRMHPNQDTLKAMMTKVGFEDVNYFNLSFSVVTHYIKDINTRMSSFLPSLSKAINAYLALDPESKHRLHDLQGKTITVELLPFHFIFSVCIHSTWDRSRTG